MGVSAMNEKEQKLSYQEVFKKAVKQYRNRNREYPMGVDVDMSVLVDEAVSLKKKFDQVEKELKIFKEFFKASGEKGEHFDGATGYIDLIGRTTTTVEPSNLQKLLSDLGRENEFLNMISVKIADARGKLGTLLFDKIAKTTSGVTVKIGTK